MELSDKKTISYGRLILVLVPAIAMVVIVGLAVINGGGSPRQNKRNRGIILLR